MRGTILAYDIFDRRTQDQIDERTLDDAIKAHTNGNDSDLANLSDFEKINVLNEAGFIVRGLPFISTLNHGSGTLPLNPLEEHIQVDFNYPDETVSFDLCMEEYEGKKYLVIQFFPKQSNFQSILKRMFDVDGNEKVFELCPHCSEEVIVDAREKVKQPCPKCGELIRACCLCPGDKDCKDCG